MTKVDSTDPQFRLLDASTHDYTIVIARFVTLLNKLLIFILLDFSYHTVLTDTVYCGYAQKLG